MTEGRHSTIPEEVGELGRTKVTKVPLGEGGCRIPRGVDLTKFWGSIEACLRRAEGASPMPPITREELVELSIV